MVKKENNKVTLLLGPFGHGKSTYIMNKIKEDYNEIIKNIEESKEEFDHNIRSYLIVPEQQTLISERQLATALPPTAQLYLEATNMTRLADTVFRKTGGLKYNYVTKGAQNLIMYSAICEVRDSLQHYKGIPVGREKSYIKLFLQAIGELKAYSISVPQLEFAYNKLMTNNAPETQTLRAKIYDLMIVWNRYSELHKDKFDDPHDTLSMLSEKIVPSGLFNGCNIYIDSFYGFTKGQLDVISKLIEVAGKVTIALDCPPDATKSTLQYVKIADTRDKILGLCKKTGRDYEIIPFETDYKHKSEELEYVCKNIWNFDAIAIEPMGDVTLATAEDEFAECEYVCTKIKEIIHANKVKDDEAAGEKDGDEQYGSIAIIARNSSTYRGIIEYCLDNYEIPYYFSAPSKLSSQPVIRMIFSALNALSGMRSQDIISYVKCGFTDIDEDSQNALESYVYRWNIYGKKFENPDYWSANPNGYKEMSKDDAKELLIIHDARDKILKMLSILDKPFKSGLPVKDCAAALYKFLEEHNVKNRLLSEIKTEIDQKRTEDAQMLSQVWGAIIDALNNVVDICGDAIADAPTFTTLLNYAMMDTKIGTIPTGEDKVIIADASLVRAQNIRHVFVLGANEGSFPEVVNDDSFFSDRDKIELETVEINLTPMLVNGTVEERGFMSAKTFERSDDELFFFSNSIAAASHTATITALKTDIGGSLRRPSIGFSRIKSILGDDAPYDFSTASPLDKIYTKKMAKELFGVADDKLKGAIKEAVEDKINEASFVTPSSSISSNLAKDIFGDYIRVAKTNLETFAKCHFNYYCSYVLNLKNNEKIKFSHNNIGDYIHKIFEIFLKEENVDKTYTRKEILDIVDKATEEYVAVICGARALSNKMKHFFERLKTTVTIFVEALIEDRCKSPFKPELFEISINGDGVDSPPPQFLPIDGNTSAILTGVADRIDVCRKDGRAYVRVVDYKTGSHIFDPIKLSKGLDMQMLIYLLALCNMKNCEFKQKLLGDKDATKIDPQGIVYLTYNIDKISTKYETRLFSADANESETDILQGKVNYSGIEVDNADLKVSDSTHSLASGHLSDFNDFNEVFEMVRSNIKRICLDMLSGDAKAEPLEGENPCDYCKNGAICRRRVKSAHAKG